ncbi:decapping and exoribonuclease protein-like isoform X2 [Dendropsophus ebraccatus]|uniref:decapping and exoribonuclease protein-like isoform X2 n=1 Tax=Dendropsophus ebraccatus TaxID=150705 RepID=UPI0038319203
MEELLAQKIHHAEGAEGEDGLCHSLREAGPNGEEAGSSSQVICRILLPKEEVVVSDIIEEEVPEASKLHFQDARQAKRKRKRATQSGPPLALPGSSEAREWDHGCHGRGAEHQPTSESRTQQQEPAPSEGTHKRGRHQDTSGSPQSKNPDMASLKTHPSSYLFQPPSYTASSELGYFSLDGKGCYHGDARRLRYLSTPAGMDSGRASLGWDVMDGFEDRYVPCNDDEKVGLGYILTWMKENRGLVQGSNRPVNQDFVTRRGLLAKIMCTPYETNEGWIMTVTLFKGTLYINGRETPAAYKNRKERPKYVEKLLYSGYKFESYICADSPGGAPRPRDVVNTNEAFCSVLQGQLASHSFLVSGEVDCKDPSSPDPSPPSCYVELKTNFQLLSAQQHYNFRRYKLLKWWSQSFLLGIPVIIAGFRNPQGRIGSLQKFRTSEIPYLARGDGQSWDPAVCMNFCNAFLSYIKEVVTRDDPRVVYVFSWEPYKDITFTIEEVSDDPVIPDWYARELS